MQDQITSDDPFTRELQRIRRLISEGLLPLAAQALNAAQDQAPEDPRVPLLGMRLADKAGNLKGAIQAARRALALAPNWHVAMLELGVLLSRNGDASEAMRLAQDAVNLDPSDPQVLGTASAIAYGSGGRPQALEWIERAVRHNPDDARLRLALGQALVEFKRHAEALPHFEWLAERSPNDTNVVLGLMSCALSAGDSATAQRHADHALALEPQDPHVQYWHGVAHGNTPPTQPDEVISNLFDGYADRFQSHLVDTLQYRVPDRIAQILTQAHPDRRFNLLDLGCGTGLVGARLGSIEGYIVGVDLSPRMIEEAAKLGVYAKFHQINVLDAVSHTPADLYEAITMAVVLVYLGDLAPVAPGALRVLKPGGHFIFSCERATDAEPDLVLRAGSNRYAHRTSAVERICQDAGFTDIQIEDLPVLRMESGQPVPGFLVTARKPLAA